MLASGRRGVLLAVAVFAASLCAAAASPEVANAGDARANSPSATDALRCSNAKIKSLRTQIAKTQKQYKKAKTKKARKALAAKLASLNKQLKNCLKKIGRASCRERV